MKTPAKNFRNHVWVKDSDGKVTSLHDKIVLTHDEFTRLRALNPPYTYILIIKPETPNSNNTNGNTNS